MNRARAAAQARRTRTTRTRSGSTSRATTPPRATSSRLAVRAAHQPRSSASTADRPTVRCAPATARARSTTATRSCALRTGSTASRPATRSQAGYVLVGSGAPRRRSARLRRARHARAWPRATPTRSRCCSRASRASSGSPRCAAATVLARVPIRYRRGAELDARRRAHRRAASCARGQRDDVDSPDRRRARPTSTGRSRAASRSARSRSCRTAAWWAACRSSPPPACPAADLEQKAKAWFTSPLPLAARRSPCLPVPSLVGRQVRRVVPRPAQRRRTEPGPHDHHRHPQHRDRQDAGGPELPARPAPPHGRADDDAGRQGRQRRARAQGARPARDRHRASPAARPARASSSSSRSCRCCSDFVRIREESRTNTAVIDPTTGEQTEINERGPKVSEQEVELFVDKLLYLAKGASMCVFAGSLPRDVDADIYAGLIRELRAPRRGDDRRHRRRPAAARGPRGARRDLAERARGRGARRPRVQRRRGRLAIAVREMCELGAREAIMTMRDGCFARMRPGDRRDRARRSTASSSPRRRWSRAPRSARATRSWPASSRPATPAAARADCLAYGVACGAESTQHLGAGLIDPERVARLLAETEVQRCAHRPRSPDPPRADGTSEGAG